MNEGHGVAQRLILFQQVVRMEQVRQAGGRCTFNRLPSRTTICTL